MRYIIFSKGSVPDEPSPVAVPVPAGSRRDRKVTLFRYYHCVVSLSVLASRCRTFVRDLRAAGPQWEVRRPHKKDLYFVNPVYEAYAGTGIEVGAGDAASPREGKGEGHGGIRCRRRRRRLCTALPMEGASAQHTEGPKQGGEALEAVADIRRLLEDSLAQVRSLEAEGTFPGLPSIRARLERLLRQVDY